jgi:hypothetical protein
MGDSVPATASESGPLRARRAILGSRREVKVPFLAGQVSADDRAGTPAPHRRVEVPQHRACFDPCNGEQLAIRAEGASQGRQRRNVEGQG